MKRLTPFIGWAAIFCLFSALFFYIAVPEEMTVILSLLATGVVLAINFVFLEKDAFKKGLKSRSAIYGTNTVVLTFLFLGVLVFINLMAHRHKHRFDVTETKAFTLAPQTKKIVTNLPREVKMTAFFQNQSPDKIKFKDLIDGYVELSDKIEVDYIDPDKSPSILKQYGVTTYGTVVLESGKQETKVQEASEENITNSLLKVSKDDKKTIYFLRGHGEKDINDNQNQGYSGVKASLERDAYKVEELVLLQTGNVPEDAALLIIAGPEKPIAKEEQEAIEKYLEQGGSVFLLVDPQSQFGMDEFLARWGVELMDNIVIDPMSKLFGGDFAAPVVSQYIFHDITKDFKLTTIFPVVRAVKPKEVEGVHSMQLLQTGENSWGETSLDATKVAFDEGVDEKGPVPVAVIATKPLATPEEDTNPSEPKGNETPDKKPAQKKSHLMVIGDSDFASNQYIAYSGNGDFFLNTSSWLTEEEDLISIRPKNRKNTPIQLTRSGGTILFFLGILVVPGCVALAGLRNWWRRRRL